MSHKLRECLRARCFWASILLHTTCNCSCCSWRASYVVTKHEKKSIFQFGIRIHLFLKFQKLSHKDTCSCPTSLLTFPCPSGTGLVQPVSLYHVPIPNSTGTLSVPNRSRQRRATPLLGRPLSFPSPSAFFSITQTAEVHCRLFDVFTFLLYFKWTELNVWSV